mmetsp:Transcript_4580/g.7908  ORF Transcript_4580/g.7908 Transcript_4580/m.7908 type:complete len:81 (-) Transcript_4580:75-317(-)
MYRQRASALAASCEPGVVMRRALAGESALLIPCSPKALLRGSPLLQCLSICTTVLPQHNEVECRRHLLELKVRTSFRSFF